MVGREVPERKPEGEEPRDEPVARRSHTEAAPERAAGRTPSPLTALARWPAVEIRVIVLSVALLAPFDFAARSR